MIRRILFSLLALLLLSKLAVVIWGLNKGFDIGDESFYLLGSKYYYLYDTFDYYRFTGKLFSLFDYNIISARILRVVFELSGSLIFSFGCYKWFNSESSLVRRIKPSFWYILLFCYLGNFLSIYDRGVSYNDFSRLFVLLILTVLLLLQSGNHKLSPSKWLAVAFTGLISGAQFFIKFPTGIILFFLIPGWLLFEFRKERFSRIMAALACFFAGFLFTLSAYFISYGGWQAWLEKTQKVYELYQLVGYNILKILGNYISYEPWVVLIVTPSLLLFWGFIQMIRKVLRNSGKSWDTDKTYSLSFIGLMPYFLLFVFSVDFFPNLLFLYALVAVISWFLLLKGLRAEYLVRSFSTSKLADNLLTLGLLFIAPFIIIIGTSGSLVESVFQNITPWFVLLGIAFKYIKEELRLPVLSYLLFALLLTLTFIQFYYYSVFHPWGLPAPLTDQKYRASGFEPVLFDEKTKQFWEEYRKVLKNANFKEGDPIISFDMMIGLVYFVKAVSPKTPVYFGYAPLFDCHYLEEYKFPEQKPFIVYRRPPNETLQKCLNDSYLDFENSYALAGKVPIPYYFKEETFYDVDDYPDLYVYAPKANRDGIQQAGRD